MIFKKLKIIFETLVAIGIVAFGVLFVLFGLLILLIIAPKKSN